MTEETTYSRVQAIADQLTPAQRKGLCSPPGSGNFSSAVFRALTFKKLIHPEDFNPTELGWQVRRVLMEGTRVR